MHSQIAICLLTKLGWPDPDMVNLEMGARGYLSSTAILATLATCHPKGLCQFLVILFLRWPRCSSVQCQQGKHENRIPTEGENPRPSIPGNLSLGTGFFPTKLNIYDFIAKVLAQFFTFLINFQPFSRLFSGECHGVY